MSIGKGAFIWALILFLVAPVFASEVIQVTIDKNIYAPGESIVATGTLYSGVTVAANFTVNVSVYNATNTNIKVNSTNTTAQGKFSVSLQAPASEGDYFLNVSAGDAAVAIPFKVSRVADIQVELLSRGIVSNLKIVPLVSLTGYNATRDPKINLTDARAGNFSFDNENYTVIVTKDGGTIYKIVFLDDDNILYFNNSDSLGSSMFKFLEKGSDVKLNTTKFELVYIDPQGSVLILASKAPLKFTGSGTESFDVLAIALNSSNAPVGGVNFTMRVYDEKGALQSTHLPQITGSDGTTVFSNHAVGTAGGVFNIVINELGRISYFVETFTFTISLTSEDGTPVYAVQPGAKMNFTASVLYTGNQTPIKQNFLMNITIVGPGCAPCRDNKTLINGTRSEQVTAPAAAGTYLLEFAVEYGGVVARQQLEFLVRTYDLFAFPVSQEKGPSQGFAPGENGSIFVGAADMGTGDILNLTTLTGNCANISLEGIFDTTGKNVFNGTYDKKNLSEFLAFMQSLGQTLPPHVQEEVKEKFGEGACVILFQAPTETGVYNAEIKGILNGNTERAFATVGVQDIFVFSYPASSSGAFTFAVNPGSELYLAINAYDSKTGLSLPAANISDASLVEVFAEDGTIVTDSMLNESFTYYPTSGTPQFALLRFVVNDSVMGNHFVRFKIKANVTRGGVLKIVEALGDGWFQERLYQVWAHPKDWRWAWSSNNSVNMTIEVRDASGINAKQNIKVYLDEVRSAMTWEKISNVSAADADSNTSTRAIYCTTNANGTCNLELIPPTSGWESGGHSARFKIVDQNNITDFGYGWFEVRGFNFFAWPSNWEVSPNREINFSVTTQTFDWPPTNIRANVSIDKVQYMGTFENWRPPTVVNSSVGVSKIINGSGTISMPAGTIRETGMYSVFLSARNDSYGKETTQAWFYARPFTVWVGVPDQQEWPPRFGTTDIVTLKVKGFDSMIWEWPEPRGDPHNLSAAWVNSVEKAGQWGVKFRTKAQMDANNNVSSVCKGNECNLTFNLTGFAQGEYSLTIGANDSTGSKADSWFWFRVENLRIGIPQLMDWMNVLDNNQLRNNTNFLVNLSCGATIGMPAGVATENCKYTEVMILDHAVHTADWDYLNLSKHAMYNVTHFLFDTNTSKLYVNKTNQSGISVNFTNSPNYTVGAVFPDSSGTRWKIVRLDAAEGRVYLEAVDGVIGHTNPGYAGDIKFLLIVNQLVSKSGTFIQADYLSDNDWLKIDLNGDGDYDWNDRYFMLLADSEKAGVYDTVLVSNTTNMSAGANSNDPKGIKLAPNAKPIYLLGIKFTAGSGGAANTYRPVFTSNQLSWWSGINLGTFKSNSIVKVPVMVTSPRNSSLLKNATVNITSLISAGSWDMKATPVTPPASIDTNATGTPGVAIVRLNTSGMALSGRYRLEIKVRDLETQGSDWVTMGNVWEYPEIEIRNFEVSGLLGSLGRISGIQEWSANVGNLQTNLSSQLVGGFAQSMDCNKLSPTFTCAPPGDPPEIFGFWWRPYGDQIYYNFTDDTILVDWDMNGDLSNAKNYTYKTQLIPVKKKYNTTEFVNVTIIKDNTTDKSQNKITVVNVGQSKTENFYNFTLATPTQLRIEKLDPWGKWIVFDGIIGPGNVSQFIPGTAFNLTEWTSNNVTLRWDGWFIVLNSGLNIEGSNNNLARLLNVSGGDLELIIYNNPSRTTSNDLSEWDTRRSTADTIRVINGSNGSMVGNKEYAFGEPITEIGDKAVVGGGEKWNERVYLSTLVIGGRAIYPLPWTCGEAIYYVGNFTENSSRIDMNWDNRANDTRQYYILFYDGMCDGVASATNYIVDDDPVLDGSQFYNASAFSPMPWDYDHREEGSPRWQWDTYNRSEDYLTIGGWGTPQITEVNFAAGNATSFTQKWGIKPNETLTVWIKARDFTGVGISGNATLQKLIKQSWTMFGYQESDVTPATPPKAQVVNGTGYLDIDTSGLGSQYTGRIQVTSDDGTKEILEIFFWIEEPMPKPPM